MLSDTRQFRIVEDALIKSGRIKDFERENESIKGRMMIVQTAIPDEIEYKKKSGLQPVAFEASFDFYDTTIGLALYTKTKEAASGLWMTPQVDEAETPSQEWVEFFIEKLFSSIDDDGSYGVPIYSFVTDSCDMTVIPSLP